MRTTVTLDDDTVAFVHRLMKERGVSFKKALNDAIREGAQRRTKSASFTTRAAALGVPTVNLDRALQVAAELEDEELIRRQRRGA
ncbi:antitoxin [Mycobacterium sp.]|uniref:antitoxin n=1 Tax=Mycobacterium sp. TaxID=1785 RepID=UPI0031D29819